MSGLALWVGVGAIGGLASIARFAVHGLFPRDSDAGFPFGTLAVNLSGSFVLGLLSGAGVVGDAYLLSATAASAPTPPSRRGSSTPSDSHGTGCGDASRQT